MNRFYKTNAEVIRPYKVVIVILSIFLILAYLSIGILCNKVAYQKGVIVQLTKEKAGTLANKRPPYYLLPETPCIKPNNHKNKSR